MSTFDFYSPCLHRDLLVQYTPYTWGVSIYDDWYYYGAGVSKVHWRADSEALTGGVMIHGWDYDPWMGYGWNSWYGPGMSYGVNFYLGRPHYHYPVAWNSWNSYRYREPQQCCHCKQLQHLQLLLRVRKEEQLPGQFHIVIILQIQAHQHAGQGTPQPVAGALLPELLRQHPAAMPLSPVPRAAPRPDLRAVRRQVPGARHRQAARVRLRQEIRATTRQVMHRMLSPEEIRIMATTVSAWDNTGGELPNPPSPEITACPAPTIPM